MRTLISLIIIAVVIAGGIWLFNRSGNNVAQDTNGGYTVTEDNFTGTGGPEEGYDPLDLDGDGDVDQDDAEFNSKG